jgi:PncC family amidohydrolase
MEQQSVTINQAILDRVAKMLIKHEQTVAVAESVTAGNLQMALSMAEGSTEFFPGGITTYNINQKVKHLNVEPMHAMACNCVSEKVAQEMGTEVIKLFNSDWGIGITGYAAPIPEKGISTLFACFAICHKDAWIKVRTIKTDEEEMMAARNFYTNEILHHFLEDIGSLNKARKV